MKRAIKWLTTPPNENDLFGANLRRAIQSVLPLFGYSTASENREKGNRNYRRNQKTLLKTNLFLIAALLVVGATGCGIVGHSQDNFITVKVAAPTGSTLAASDAKPFYRNP